MAPRLITMLTHNDRTVPDAEEVFAECADLAAEYWGFKDVGLPPDRMRSLVRRIKEAGKTAVLEVVSYSEEECLAAARLALDHDFDYLMGTVFHESVFDLVRGSGMTYFPFCGRVSGSPSILEGDVADIIEEARALGGRGVEGFDLLAYRYTGDAEYLARRFVAEVGLPVVVAGSISSYRRLDRMKEWDPWGFTIGGAFFERVFVPGGTFRQQVERVTEYLGAPVGQS